jgi:hypothetical protein
MNFHAHIRTLLAVSLFVMLFDGCKSDDDDTSNENQPVILSFTPTSGIVGDEVVITGTHFSPAVASNFVKFNGTAAEVLEATENELTVNVPNDATTGPISVTVSNVTGTSTTPFTVPLPTIVDFTPTLGGAGTSVIITGENFAPTANLNIVKFNGTAADVTLASSNALEVSVPAAATTGKISVQVGANTATSTDDFVICEDAELAILEASATSSGDNTNYSITIVNLGKAPLDLSKFSYQNYASNDMVVNGGDAAGGGSQLDAGGILETGETYTVNSSAGVNSTTFTYFLITISLKDGQTVNECTTSNNFRAVTITH